MGCGKGQQFWNKPRSRHCLPWEDTGIPIAHNYEGNDSFQKPSVQPPPHPQSPGSPCACSQSPCSHAASLHLAGALQPKFLVR